MAPFGQILGAHTYFNKLFTDQAVQQFSHHFTLGAVYEFMKPHLSSLELYELFYFIFLKGRIKEENIFRFLEEKNDSTDKSGLC